MFALFTINVTCASCVCQSCVALFPEHMVCVLAFLRLPDIMIVFFAEYLRYVLCTDDYCVC